MFRSATIAAMMRKMLNSALAAVRLAVNMDPIPLTRLPVKTQVVSKVAMRHGTTRFSLKIMQTMIAIIPARYTQCAAVSSTLPLPFPASPAVLNMAHRIPKSIHQCNQIVVTIVQGRPETSKPEARIAFRGALGGAGVLSVPLRLAARRSLLRRLYNHQPILRVLMRQCRRAQTTMSRRPTHQRVERPNLSS